MGKVESMRHHREIYKLGKRAIRYYIDTGLCVFCDADDCCHRPHEDHCNVGKLSGVVVNEERRKKKNKERGLVHDIVVGRSKK